MLRAALLGEPLPGSTQPLAFPDVQFLRREPRVLLLRDHLAGPVSVEGVRLIGADEVRQPARDLAYLAFRPPVLEDGAVRLTLEARMASSDPARHPLGLGGITARFVESSGEWRLAGEPQVFAI